MKTQLTSFVLFFCCLIIFAQNKLKFEPKQFDQILNQTYLQPFNGVVLISQNGKEIYSKSFGYADYENKSALTKDHPFLINSNSKLFTSVLILLEMEKGNLNLHIPIKTYMPELKDSWTDSISIHQLMNHTNGIDDFGKPLLFKPGTDFKYGNISNRILGKILQNVTGKTYRELATELYHRLEMKTTYCVEDNQSDLVSSYRFVNGKMVKVEKREFPEEGLPAFGIVSTIQDMTKWNFLLHNGKILQDSSYQLMVNPSAFSQHIAFGEEKMGYSYNIRIAEQNGVNYVGHTGLGQGFTALNVYFPEENISLVVLENLMSADANDWYKFEILLKEELIRQISKATK